MNSINPEAFTYLLSLIEDGNLFENFTQDLLCEILNQEFVPIGGVKDRGIDGLDHITSVKGKPKTIYQISIQKDTKSKIRNTLRALRQNKIECNRLFYVTNRYVRDQDLLIESLFDEFEVNVAIRDAAWLRGNINHSEGTLRIYANFVEKYTHDFNRPGTEVQVKDFTGDPRVFVFLRQQIDQHGADRKLDELLVESLILFALEGTDPDKDILRSREEILERIGSVASFSTAQIDRLLDARLNALTTKPRRVNHHKSEDKYCLPYTTRLYLAEQKLEDEAVYHGFTNKAGDRFSSHLEKFGLQLNNSEYLLRSAFNLMFKRQGLDFANFMLEGEGQETVENALDKIIAEVMESGGVSEVNRPNVGLAIWETIRDIIYRGSKDEQNYLQRLSRSYLMLFLLQCEPHVCAYFDALAAKLKVYVCNSILVPALSEICLEPQNRRNWNLLSQATAAGVDLLLSTETLDELVSHIQITQSIYEKEYNGYESKYAEECTIRYVEPIIIRAYLYQRSRGDNLSFSQFLNKFVTPDVEKAKMALELKTFLHEEFGVSFIEDRSLGIEIDQDELDGLTTVLQKMKGSEHKARSDAKTILTIYGLRERNNEAGSSGAFGYRTWWLSKDTTTHRAVKNFFGKEQRVSCYLRPDFMLSYITLTASFRQASKVFDEMFPTLVGVSISHHVDENVSRAVHSAIKEHNDLSPSRITAVVASMTSDIMTKRLPAKKTELKNYLDEKLSQR